MTLLAGAFSHRGPLRLSEPALSMLRDGISRNAEDRPVVTRYDRAYIVKLDLGSFGEPALWEEAGAVSMVAGEPLVARAASRSMGRAHDVALLHRALQEEREGVLRETQGTFSLAHYDVAKGRLLLATDKVGVRPLYWWTDGETVAFSSTLRLLETLPWVTKELDQRGLAELLAFGFPLGPRTPYASISLLEPGELVEFTPAGAARREYWRWQDVSPSWEDSATLTRRAYEAFAEAVRLRQRTDRYTTAFLSGGLDSRCVVAALRAEGVGVHTFNFAQELSEDRVYGAALAQAAGTTHEERPVHDAVNVRWSEMIANARATSVVEIKERVERPNLYWSGDGGSVCMGHVYIRPAIVERCRSGDLEGAADAYVAAEHATLPLSLLTAEAAHSMGGAPRQGVVEELTRLRMPDLLQSFYLMLLHNDQHRHLHQHFEDIDLHRVELQLPFFDAVFLAAVASVPVEARLYHRFYTSWLAHFPRYVRETYWQAYPGHVPSPVPHNEVLSYQWDPSSIARRRASVRWRAIRMACDTLFSRDFPASVMRRRMLVAAALIQLSGLKDLDYIIYAASAIQRHWRAFRSSTLPSRG
jgi:asparagine synthase (glutamine-hydrolysing)